MNTDELLARRHGPSQRMTIPVDPDTTRSLQLLTHDPVPWKRRLLRWWERRKRRWLGW